MRNFLLSIAQPFARHQQAGSVRPRTLACIAVALLAGGLLVQSLTGESTPGNTQPADLPFATGFEPDEGFQPGSWQPAPPQPGATSWMTEGDLEIIDTDAAVGTQSLRLHPASPAPAIELPTAPHADGSIVFIDFYLKPSSLPEAGLPSAFDDATSNAIAFVASPDGSQAELYGIDGDGAGSGEWAGSGVQISLLPDGQAAEWIRLTYRLDYTDGYWDLFVDGELTLANLGFVDDSANTLIRFLLRGDSDIAVTLDELFIGTENPLFTDTSRDGLADDWLLSYGLDPTISQRDLSPDQDGLSTLREALLNTDPTLFDTDGDGVSDGDEIAAGTDPNFPSFLTGSIQLPAAETFESQALGSFPDGNGWFSEGAIEIVEAEGPEGNRILQLQALEEAETPALMEWRIDGRNEPVVWVDTWIQPVFFDHGTPELAARTAAGFYFNQEGDLHVFDGTLDEWQTLPESPRPLNLSPVAPGDWARLTVRLDYSAQEWTVWLNGVRAGDPVGFANSVDYFSRFMISSGLATGLDTIAITATQPDALAEPEIDDVAPDLQGEPELVSIGEGLLRIEWPTATDNHLLAGYRLYRDGTLLAELPLDTVYEDSTIVAGETYDYQIQAVDDWGNLSSLSDPLTIEIPQPPLLAGSGLLGQYFADRSFEGTPLERLDPELDMRWLRTDPPIPGLPGDHYQIRWTGLLEAGATGWHQFELLGRDGVRLWLDGELLVDEWTNGHSTTEFELWLEQGEQLPLVVELYDNTWGCQIRLRWDGPLEDKLVNIPTGHLYPEYPGTQPLGHPAALTAAEVLDNRVELEWNAGPGQPPVGYRVWRDGVEIAQSWASAFRDLDVEPDTAYTYQIQAEALDGTLSDLSDPLEIVSAPNPLPEPWRHRDIGVFAELGISTWDPYLETFSIEASGRDLFSDILHSNLAPDGFHFVYQKRSGDFAISARIDSHQAAKDWAKAGVMIRRDLEGLSPHQTATISYNNPAQVLTRQTIDTPTIRQDLPGFQAPYWVKVERHGDTLTSSYSHDGQVWEVHAVQQVALPEEVYAGLVVSALDTERSAASVFSQVRFLVDQDQDGISDEDEIAAGTDPLNSDTDGDGFSDWEELHVYYSDPLRADISVAGVVGLFTGADGSGTFGQWSHNGGIAVSQTVQAKLEFSFEITEPGIYRVLAEVAAAYNDSASDVFPVVISLDGQQLDRVPVYLPDAEPVTIYSVTPWLTAGTHTVELFFDNTQSHRALQVNSVTVEQLDGLDENQDDTVDWMDNRLAENNQLTTSENGSLVSPFMIEGVAAYRDLLEVRLAGETIEVSPAPGSGWFADLPLDPASPTPAQVAFENGGVLEEARVKWLEFNVIEQAAQDEEAETSTPPIFRLRLGDALRLTAHETEVIETSDDDNEGNNRRRGRRRLERFLDRMLSRQRVNQVHPGQVDITVTSPAGEVAEYAHTRPQESAEPHQFLTPGLHQVDATFTPQGQASPVTASMQIEVVEAEFNGDPTVGGQPPLVWDNPLLPEDIVIVADQGISLQELERLPQGGARLQISSGNLGESYLAARLDEAADILDNAIVYALKVSSNGDTAIDILQVYPDGSRLIGTPIMLSRVTPDTRIEVEIFVAGVTFEDGTTSKTFTAEDFDEYGRLYVKFIKPADRVGSYCHRIHVYEGDTYIGKF